MTAYASHLSELTEKKEIVASEDILSQNRVLIAKSGSRLNQSLCKKIVNFKLLKPLEETISISDQLNSKQVFETIIKLLNKDIYSKDLNTRLGKKGSLENCCISLEKYPLLLQKLTVMQLEMKDVFYKSLLSAVLAYLCGVIKHLPQDQIQEHFLAGIAHDIGFLHIDRQILLKKQKLSAEEWRNIQAHPIIGYEILKRTPNFPTNSALATLEHHENLDGSGYPRGKTIHDLSNLGQLINLLDNAIVIYQKKFEPLNRSPLGVIPIIQINMHSYLPDVVSTIFQLFKSAPPSIEKTPDISVLKELVNYINEQKRYIMDFLSKIKLANTNIGFTHENKSLFSLQNIAINLVGLVNSSGLGDSNINWTSLLESDENKENLYKEIEDARLIQEELIYQLDTYHKTANGFASLHKDDQASKHLQEILELFANEKTPQVPELIKKHWKTLAS